MGVVACIVWPALFTYFNPGPTPEQTLTALCYRFLEFLIPYVPLSYYFLGRAWDRHNKNNS